MGRSRTRRKGCCHEWGKLQSFVFWVPLIVLLARELQPRFHQPRKDEVVKMSYTTPISAKDLLAEGRPFLEPQSLEPLSPFDPSNGLLVAHCIAGAARTLDRKEAYSLYKSHAIDSLDAPSVVFMVLEKDINTEIKTTVSGIFRGDERRLGHEGYRAAFDALKPAGVVWLDSNVKTDEIYDMLESGSRWTTSPLKGHPRRYLKKHHVCYRMLRFYEAKHKVQFSHVVVTRPDIMLPIPIGPAAAWPAPDNSSHVMTALYNTWNTFFVPNLSMWHEVDVPQEETDKNDLAKHATDIFNVLPRAAMHTLLDGWRRPCCLQENGNWIMGDRVMKLGLENAGLERTFRAFKFKILRGKQYCRDLLRDLGQGSLFLLVAYC